MKRKKLSILLSMAMLFSVVATACGDIEEEERETEETTPTTSQITITEPMHDIDIEVEENEDEIINTFFSALNLTEKEFYPTENSVHFSGRHINYNGVEYLSNTCSSIDFVMTGDRVEAVIVSNASSYKDTYQGYIAVVINGEVTEKIKVLDGENSYTLYEGEKLINADISIVRLSECMTANIGVKSITCNATSIAPKRDSSLQIEFIGDSITCGYGNEDTEASTTFDAVNENGMKSYAYLTAQALNADASLVCASGIGIISDCTTNGVLSNYLLMPDMYEYADMNFELRRSISDYTEWDFGEGSDVVVINLGTNDYTYTGKNEDLQAEFGSAYYDFIGQVREHNPNAIIICTLGILGSELYSQIEYATAQFIEDNGDLNVYTYKFDYQSEEDGYGTDYHPSAATHEKAAEGLTEYIKGLLGM